MNNILVKASRAMPLVYRNSLVAAIASTTLSPAAMGLDGSSAVLEEIIVNATRRVETIQDVPVAVSAIPSSELTKSGIFETSDLNRIAPNIQVSSPYGAQQPNFSIRGVGVGTEYNANAASPVGVYVDEVYQTFRASHGQQLYDLEQVEILRGPQGTLFGRNTTGGAINFITRKPELDNETSGYITVGYGNYNRKNFEGAVEFTPVEDKFGVRLSGTYVETDPYVENKLPKGLNTSAAGGASGLNLNSGVDPAGSENYGLRASFRFVPTDEVDLMLKVYKAESEGGTEVPIPVGSTKSSDAIDYTNPNFLLGGLFSNLSGAGLLPANYSQSANGLDVREIESDTASEAFVEAEGIVLSATVEINEDLTFIGIAGYDSGEYRQDPNTDCDATPLRLCSIGYESEFDAYNIDVRFDYLSGPLKLTVGAFYGEDSMTSDNTPDFFNFLRDVNAAVGSAPGYFNPGGNFNGALLPADALPTGIDATQHFAQDRESWAIYGEGVYELTETVNVTLGLRYSDDTLEFSEGLTTYYDDTGAARLLTVSDHELGGAFQPYFLADFNDAAGNLVATASTLNGGAQAPAPLEVDGSSDKFSGRVIVDWHASDDTMLYASFSRGYRAGTMNGLAYGSANQIYFVEPEEVDAFELGFKSTLLNHSLQLNGALFYYDYTGQQGQVVDSTATANLISLDGTVTGVEIDAKYAVTNNLVVTASVGWLDTEYDDDPCPATPVTGFPAQQGSCVVSSGGQVNVGGNPFPYAAELTFNAGFDWDIMSTDEGDLTLHGDAVYTGQYYYDAFEDYSESPLPTVASGDFTEGEGEYWIYNARMSYSTEQYIVSLWGKNLSDEEYYPYGISVENLFANGYRVLAQPRTYGAELKYFF